MYVVVVDFEVHPGRLSEFLTHMLENARESRETETGCRQFDVCQDLAMTDHVWLYELYDDRAAFEAHLATKHFEACDGATRAMVKSKALRTMQRLSP